MAGRPKRDHEVKSYLVRLPPVLIDRIEYCCSLLDVATRQRLPRNTRVQQALEEWCERVEAGQQTLAPTPGLPPASVPSVPKPSPSPAPTESQLLAPEEKKQTNSEDIERILSAREL